VLGGLRIADIGVDELGLAEGARAAAPASASTSAMVTRAPSAT
jgi:hypothetical protein